MNIHFYKQISLIFGYVAIEAAFFKQKTAYEISACLVGSEMCIRDRGKPGWTVQILQEPGYYAVIFTFDESGNNTLSKYSIKYRALGDYNNTVYQAGRILEILNGEPV